MYAGNQKNVSNHQRKEVLEELSRAAAGENFLFYKKKKKNQCMKGIILCGFPWHQEAGLSYFRCHFQTCFPCISSFPATPDFFRFNT